MQYQKTITETKAQVLGLALSRAGFAQVLADVTALAQARQPAYVCFANVHMTMEAWWRPAFSAQVNGATHVVPDGMPLVAAQRLLYGAKAERVAGMDFLPAVLERCAEHGIGVYFYGSTEETLAATRARLERELPTLRVAGMVSPPFRPLTEAETAAQLEAIRASGAGVVCVALGCPKQETWMAQHSEQLPCVLLGIGGALPQYAGLVQRAPGWMQRLALEWFYRFVQEPRRLFKRYFVTNTSFLWHLALQWLVGRRVG